MLFIQKYSECQQQLIKGLDILDNNYKTFYTQIINFIPKEYIFTDKLHTLVYGTDASFYRLIPKVVIKAQNSNHIQDILKIAKDLKLPITFRAAGTSLSGQAISDSILIITARTWTKVKISNDAKQISLEPSVIGSNANKFLASYGRKIGPDPASINSAMIGGIAANNASGMCCGISQNSYKTLNSMKIIFYDGTKLDTSCQKSKEKFLVTHKYFIDKLKQFSTDVKSNTILKEKIRKKFKIKNTCGYSLNALVDFDDIFEIIEHLMIGSEGTLGFIEEVTYNTVIDYPQKASSLVFFRNIIDACNAVKELKTNSDIKVDAVELMDRIALKSVEHKQGMPSYLKTLHKDVTTLLIETRASSADNLNNQINNIKYLLKSFDTVYDIEFTNKEEEYSLFWKIRKGLFPAVGAMRDVGTTVIIEDIAFPIDDLADATIKLQELFLKYDYTKALIFGHALEGNLHFVFTQDFSSSTQIIRYDNFMKDVTALVISFDGSLKAEHGTGRNMAPFVELEWGIEAYEMMKSIKNLFDPLAILNSGVIINDDAQAHIQNLKPMPATNDIVDKCIECGFCEPICPSNIITLTPRHRIVANRQISALKASNNTNKAKLLKDLYKYVGLDTCATCSLCSTLCPVDIDTGNLTKHLREKELSSSDNKNANHIKNNFSRTLSAMKFALKTSYLTHKILGDNLMTKMTKLLRTVTSNKIPYWSPYLPNSTSINTNIKNNNISKEKIVYFPSCINRTMGNSVKSTQDEILYDVTIKLLKKAGYSIILPSDLNNLCCGMPFSSKGFNKQASQMSHTLEEQLKIASQNGKYPILCDTSPCTKKMTEDFKNNLKIYEPIEFALEYLVPKLDIQKTNESIVIHSTCSTRKLQLDTKFIELANLCSSNVIVPKDVYCCGFAGDRGFNFPELNKSALHNLKSSIPKDVKLAFSTSKTCEIGLSQNSKIDYNSIFYLIDSIST